MFRVSRTTDAPCEAAVALQFLADLRWHQAVGDHVGDDGIEGQTSFGTRGLLRERAIHTCLVDWFRPCAEY